MMENNLFSNYSLPPRKKRADKRADLIKDIYALYSEDKLSRKKENWKRYCNWLKENKIPNTKENQNKFSRTRLFVKEQPIRTFCVFLSHIKTDDLFLLYSTAKDISHRDFGVGVYIASHFPKANK